MANTIEHLSIDDIRDLLATILAGAAGGAKSHWLELIGDVEPLPTWRYVRFNWRVTPRGSAEERKAIDKAVEIVRAEHPYIT